MFKNEIIDEVRKNREQVLIDAGGFDNWWQNIDKIEEQMKMKGFKFATLEDVVALKELSHQ